MALEELANAESARHVAWLQPPWERIELALDRLAAFRHNPSMARTKLFTLVLALHFAACHTDASGPPAPTMPQASTTVHELTPIGSVLWHTDYDAAVEVARAEGKPLWVHFGEDPG